MARVHCRNRRKEKGGKYGRKMIAKEDNSEP
jgi:hypothetical protein